MGNTEGRNLMHASLSSRKESETSHKYRDPFQQVCIPGRVFISSPQLCQLEKATSADNWIRKIDGEAVSNFPLKMHSATNKDKMKELVMVHLPSQVSPLSLNCQEEPGEKLLRSRHPGFYFLSANLHFKYPILLPLLMWDVYRYTTGLVQKLKRRGKGVSCYERGGFLNISNKEITAYSINYG